MFGELTLPLLYGLNVATSYMLMLAAMTYNAGLFVTVCIGELPGAQYCAQQHSPLYC